jgi:undecaprenyl diphosphate synthase
MQEVQHIAIIMDGNGRWAKKQGLPRVAGHRQGVESVRRVVRVSRNLGIPYLTLYTFSTENWNRPKKEVTMLMDMLSEMLRIEMKNLHKNNIRINAIGRIHSLYENAQAAINEAQALTKNNTGLVLTFCLSYGGRAEIVDGIKKIIAEDRKMHLDIESLDEDVFHNYLYDPSLPDPDLLIRTGSEKRERISNFLIWQIAYTEIVFTKTLWPDFSEDEFTHTISIFQERERLFGGINRPET